MLLPVIFVQYIFTYCTFNVVNEIDDDERARQVVFNENIFRRISRNENENEFSSGKLAKLTRVKEFCKCEEFSFHIGFRRWLLILKNISKVLKNLKTNNK